MPYRIEDVECIKETEKAILVYGGDFDEETWIPISQVHDDSEVWKYGHFGTLIVNDWFAEKQGWL